MKNNAAAIIFHTRICAEATNSIIASENLKFSLRAFANKFASAWRSSMDIVEKYELFSKIGYISAIIFLFIAVVLFFVLKITKVFGYLTGITRKKAISQIKRKNENNENIENNYITDQMYVSKTKKRRSIFKISSANIANEFVTADLSSLDEDETSIMVNEISNNETSVLNDTETTLLSENQSINETFKIIKEITFIHTNVNI